MSDKISVLVIDDDKDMLDMVQYALDLAGFDIVTVDDGKKGLKLAKKNLPDIILLDTTMPEMDGLQVLSHLKHDDKTKDILVFMLTGKTTMNDVEIAFNFGADDYITKPVEVMKLGNIIKAKMQKFQKA